MSFAAQISGKAATLWHIQRVKRLVRDVAGLGPLSLITVVEIDCWELDCPGPTTQITILDPYMEKRCLVLHLPISAIQVSNLNVLQT
ncbi:MAG: hypothetical protein MRY77_13045 [Rhodobacteraceae bacterium]|nr:hypothetical protein [Paracoccaceae bacterium]